MKILIEIDTDNAAWTDSPEKQCDVLSERISDMLYSAITRQKIDSKLRDSNGNATGTIKVVEG